MSLDLYHQVLSDIGHHFGITLHPDSNNSCLLFIREAIQIQIEMDKSQQNLIIGSNLGEIPPGRFREIFLAEALRANGPIPPRVGTFAYSNRKTSLILFERFPLEHLNIPALIEIIPAFTEKALLWKEAIRNGQPPSIQYSTSAGPKQGMFGL